MNSADFTLQHSDQPQPVLLDEEISTHDWPLPLAVKVPEPPRSLFWQIVEALW